jgi:hypothetical protein
LLDDATSFGFVILMAALCLGWAVVVFVVEDVPSLRAVPSEGFANRDGLVLSLVECLSGREEPLVVVRIYCALPQA